jgi:uncharacterized UPF0160 family protein
MDTPTPKKLMTHSGSFHADDVFATATLSILLERRGEKFEVIRTRDEKLLKTGDYVYDVGGEYDPERNRFDHHQVGGAGKRLNGIEYSSFGLVWKKFGVELTGSEKVATMIDGFLVAPIDAHDNGQTIVEKKYDISPYLVQDIFFHMQPTWREMDLFTYDDAFVKAVALAKDIILRTISVGKDTVLAEDDIINIYNDTKDKRVIILDRAYPYKGVVQNFPETLYVIYPRSDGSWGVSTVTESPNSFKNRKNLPKTWAGLYGEELQNVTGVRDAIFCHRALFLTAAKSKEGAIQLAELALES